MPPSAAPRRSSSSSPLLLLLTVLLLAHQVAVAFVPVIGRTPAMPLRLPLQQQQLRKGVRVLPSLDRRPMPFFAGIEIVGEVEEDESAPTGFLAPVKRWWEKTAKIDRKKLAALGASAVCSYGLVSNINYCGTLCASYIIFSKKYSVSPFAPGQWKNFLAVYGTLWISMNFLRPIRVWLALGLTPYFDQLVEKIRAKFQVKKSVALGITIFLVNICGTFSFLFTGLYLSSLYTGIPLFPPRP